MTVAPTAPSEDYLISSNNLWDNENVSATSYPTISNRAAISELKPSSSRTASAISL